MQVYFRLVTDLTPKEIIFGKLGGIFFNAKEMILLPAALCVACWWFGRLSTENLVFTLISLVVLNAFVAMLGVHAGMTYANSRSAVGVSGVGSEAPHSSLSAISGVWQPETETA